MERRYTATDEAKCALLWQNIDSCMQKMNMTGSVHGVSTCCSHKPPHLFTDKLKVYINLSLALLVHPASFFILLHIVHFNPKF